MGTEHTFKLCNVVIAFWVDAMIDSQILFLDHYGGLASFTPMMSTPIIRDWTVLEFCTLLKHMLRNTMIRYEPR